MKKRLEPWLIVAGISFGLSILLAGKRDGPPSLELIFLDFVAYFPLIGISFLAGRYYERGPDFNSS